jgi:hypothetical protein
MPTVILKCDDTIIRYTHLPLDHLHDGCLSRHVAGGLRVCMCLPVYKLTPSLTEVTTICVTVLVLKRDRGGPMGGTCVLSRSAYYSIHGATSSSPASLPRVEPMWKSVRFLHGFFLMCFSVFILSYKRLLEREVCIVYCNAAREIERDSVRARERRRTSRIGRLSATLNRRDGFT